MDQSGFEEFLRDVARAQWPNDLWFVTVAYFEKRGFPLLSYHHIPPLGAPDAGRVRITASGFPDPWLRDYIKQKKFRHDPYPAQAISGDQPFLWSRIGLLRALTPKEQDFVDEVAEQGFGEGWSFPVFGPGGRTGYFGLGFGAPGPRPISESGLRGYQAAMQIAHLRYCHILAAGLPPPPNLSEREREMLEWVAKGKSNSVIADIMQISPHTVDAYLRRVFLKLGTTDRISAAIKALGSVIIRGY